MTQKLKITTLSILFLLMALSSMALVPVAQVLLSPTPTLKPIKSTPSGTRLVKLKPTLTAATPLAGSSTATPAKTRPAPLPRDLQAGNSDRIAVIGILIVAIIFIPILLRRKEWW